MALSPLTLLLLVLPARLETEFGLGGDYSSQRYWPSVYDTLEPEAGDTIDVETESRAFLTLGLDIGPWFAARNYAGFSTRSVRDRLELSLRGDPLPWFGLQATSETELKRYHGLLGDDDTLYRTDHLANSERVGIDIRPRPGLCFSAWDRLQIYHYPEPDSYTYDYLLNETGLEVRRQLGMLSELEAGYTLARRNAGEQSYTGHEIEAGLDLYLDAGPQIRLAGRFDRRAHAARQWSHRELGPEISLRSDLGDRLAIDIADEGSWTLYDSLTTVNRNSFTNTVQLDIEARLGTDLTLRAGPRHELGLGLPKPNDDDYRELAIAAGLDLMLAGRLWLSLEDRLGRRRYPLADSSLQSDYAFNEVNLFVNWTIFSGRAGAMSLDGMAGISPEWHARTTDNFSTRIYTLEIKYRF